MSFSAFAACDSNALCICSHITNKENITVTICCFNQLNFPKTNLSFWINCFSVSTTKQLPNCDRKIHLSLWFKGWTLNQDGFPTISTNLDNSFSGVERYFHKILDLQKNIFWYDSRIATCQNQLFNLIEPIVRSIALL